jgi:geranylgeranyl pyrophosphate synthase
MLSTIAFGQDLDIQNPTDEASYWGVVENKSAPFYGCALFLGALFGKATDPVAKELRHFGELYGEMIQIHDDLNDTMAVLANPDWLQGRKPLPILFALTVGHPERSRFSELYQNISAENALQEAQDILIQCDAVSYCVDQILRRHQAARDILDKTPLPNRGTVDSLIDAVSAPIWKLFESLDISFPASPTVAWTANRE